MALSSFDKYFSNRPPFDRKDDFTSYWDKSILEIKKIPIKPVLKRVGKKTTYKFTVYEASFDGHNKVQIKGWLFIPKNKKKPKVIIYIHDYNNINEFNQQDLDTSTAYYFITLRGHDIIPTKQVNEQLSPGYMIENIMDINNYYVKSVYLDLLKSIEMLRLIKKLDCSSIGIIGKGFGSAAAIFCGVFSKRVKALVLEAPSFCELPKNQNLSTSDAAKEINNFIPLRKGKKKLIKQNLTYFDAINFSDMLSCPTLVTVGFKDTLSPPECIFGLFNNLSCDKTIEIYPKDGNEAGGKNQFIKSIKWLIEKINI